jgi:hypothetical protein
MWNVGVHVMNNPATTTSAPLSFRRPGRLERLVARSPRSIEGIFGKPALIRLQIVHEVVPNIEHSTQCRRDLCGIRERAVDTQWTELGDRMAVDGDGKPLASLHAPQ